VAVVDAQLRRGAGAIKWLCIDADRPVAEIMRELIPDKRASRLENGERRDNRF
jgi:hypothetical protein